MSNQLKQDYAHAYKVWLSEQAQAPLNAGVEPPVPAGLTPDEARTLREQVKKELG